MKNGPENQNSIVEILVIGSDPSIVRWVEGTLLAEGMSVAAIESTEALSYLDENHADIIILDVDGNRHVSLELCQVIRGRTMAPLLLLTRDAKDSTVARALEMGADAYAVKPLTNKVFLAQIYALLRWIGLLSPGHAGQVDVGGLVINTHRREVRLDDRPVNLSPTEYRILSCLVNNAGRPLSCSSLVKNVHGYRCHPEEAKNILRVHIHNLRRKIEPDPEKPRFIRTVRGFGYVFERRGHARNRRGRTRTSDRPDTGINRSAT
jgi:DNA-binding response OmpR family regulator